MLFIFAPLISSAQSGRPGSAGGTAPGAGAVRFNINIENPFNCGGTSSRDCTIESFLRRIIEELIIPIGGVVAALMIMWAGFLYVTSAGDTTKIKRAHDALLHGVIGAAILLGAWVISQAIEATINQIRR